jgi:hypothetical protein
MNFRDSRAECHRIWEAQSRATHEIKERFGVESALAYLLGEKLLAFAEIAERQPEFALELPYFQAAILEIFNPHELTVYISNRTPSVRRRLNELLDLNLSRMPRQE